MRIKEDTCHYACLGSFPNPQRLYEDQPDHAILSFYQLTVIQQLQAPSWIDSVSWQRGKPSAIGWEPERLNQPSLIERGLLCRTQFYTKCRN
jgi:hypothetical protein